MKPFLDDERYGSLVLAVVLSSPTHSERKMAPIIAALEDFGPPKPVVFAMMGEDSEVAPEIIAKLREPGRTVLSLARAGAARAGAACGAARATACIVRSPVVERAGKRLPAGVIPEYAAKRILAEAGIPFPRAELVSDLHDAQRAAARIGYPVVLKAQSSGLAHKSDVGGVVLGIADDAALAEGLAQAPCRYRQGAPGPAARWRPRRSDGAPGCRTHRGCAQRSRLGPGSGGRPGRRLGRGAARRAGVAGRPCSPPRSSASSASSRPHCC